ncbi:MAG TPA: hypothetical protein VJ841_03875 [Candidatus Saccharimonadales bacterium]|nr:hypothetical protein [Candidatus Saccharimonadales bacterium]
MSTENFILTLLFLLVPAVCFTASIILNTPEDGTPSGRQAAVTAPTITTKPSRKETDRVEVPAGSMKYPEAPTHRRHRSVSTHLPTLSASSSPSPSQTMSPSPSSGSTFETSSTPSPSTTGSIEPTTIAPTATSTESESPLTETP